VVGLLAVAALSSGCAGDEKPADVTPSSSPTPGDATPSPTTEWVPTSVPIPPECLIENAPPVSLPLPGPDPGGLIAFLGDGLEVIAPDGSGRRRLAAVSAGQGLETFPRWSPDGSRIAFMAPGISGPTGIYTIRPDGTDVRWVTDVASVSIYTQLAWSPDSQRIAFSYLPTDVVGPAYPAIHVVNADGSGRRQLTDGLAWDYFPAWSPGGTRIAFASERDGNREIYVMDASGAAQTRLTTDPLEDDRPSWSPDGRQVLFVSNRDVDPARRAAEPQLYVPEIYVMNSDGSDQRNLTRNDEWDSYPVWSPDGDRIAFVSARDGNAEIYVMNADGSGTTRVTDYPCVDASPDVVS